MIQLLSKIWY